MGILLVDKPKGWTSFDVVNYVRKLVAAHEGKKSKNVKVGHIGTLDPLATGLLVLLVGKEYTRRAAELSRHDKIYEVTMYLGKTSSTGDEEGDKQTLSERVPSREAIEAALVRFLGQSTQKPPVYSAVKVNGQRAYKLARAGQTVELHPRQVTIYDIKFQNYEYPFVRFSAHVSSGTYIRSLVEDIGKVLQTGAYTSDLRRTGIGDWRVGDARQIVDVNTALLSD